MHKAYIDYKGVLTPSEKIERFAFVEYKWKEKSSPLEVLIFDDLKAKGLIS